MKSHRFAEFQPASTCWLRSASTGQGGISRIGVEKMPRFQSSSQHRYRTMLFEAVFEPKETLLEPKRASDVTI